MTMAIRLGWILVGIVIGVVLMTSIRAQAQPNARQPARLVFLQVPASDNSATYFIKDTKNGACWLAAAGGIAPAPEVSCAGQ
jgi:hypothetical protein